jgi:Na+-translocating ferredoxin:NAD+ oxidoreductase subunit G
MLGQSISKNSLILGLFALLAAAALALVNLGTQDRIATAERVAKQKALFDIIPANQIDNDLLQDTMSIPAAGVDLLGLNDQPIYIARKNNKIVALIIPAMAHDGYSGDIGMLVGVHHDGSIAGIRVLTHKETPGLGDKIELKKSTWILSFNGKSLTAPVIEEWKVKKDGGEFDQFAGATITPRAVVKQIKQVLEFAQKHPQLFESSSNPRGDQHE